MGKLVSYAVFTPVIAIAVGAYYVAKEDLSKWWAKRKTR